MKKRKPFKRVLSIFLCAVMLLGCVPLAAFAVQEQSSVPNDTDVSVNSDNDFSKIVMSKVEAENDESPYEITEITIKNKTATVLATAPDNSTLIVAVYTENGEMLGYSIQSADSKHEEFSVSLETIDFSEHYVVKGYLVDEKKSSLCKEYVNRENTVAYENFLELTVDDFDSENVLNFDSDKTNNFAVLAKGTIKSETKNGVNVLKSYNEETDTYVISNADSTVKSLKKGDIFYLKTGESVDDFIIAEVSSVTVNGNIVTIMSGEETVESVFDCIKIDSGNGLSEDDVVNAQLGSALTLVEDEESGISLCGVDVDIDTEIGNGKSVTTSINYKLNEATSVNGSLKFSFSAKIRIYYDAKLFNEDYFEYSFSHTEKLSVDVSVTGKVSVDKDAAKIEIFDIPIAGTPISISLNIIPVLEFSVSGTFSVSVKQNFIQTYNPYDGERKYQKKDKEWDADLKVKFNAKIGFGIELELKCVEIISLSSSVTAALEVEGEPDGYIKCLLDKYHYCDSCIEGEIDYNITIDIELKLEITKKLKWSILKGTILDDKVKLCDFYISNINGTQTSGFSTCPNKMYKINFEIVAYSGISQVPVKGAKIALGSGKTDTNGDGMLDSSIAVTDKDGKTYGYYKSGSYEATVTASGYQSKSTKFAASASTITQKLILSKDDSSVTPNPVDPSNPSGEGGLTGSEKTGDLIEFGSYPQSRVTDANLLSALGSQTKTWKSYGYYSGTGSYGTMVQGDWMKYADVTYNGSKYRAVTFSQLRPGNTCSTNPTSGSNQTTNGYTTKAVYWFKFEPIKWRVLDPASGLVMCESLIDSQPYSNTIYYSGGEYYNDSSYTNYANDYATSSIRAWLNDDFYNTAFSSSQKSQIAVTECNNSCYSLSYPRYNSDMTYDKVFLLSYNEVKYSGYGFSSNASRTAQGTDYAKCQGLSVTPSSAIYGGNSWWWLRSPYSNSDYACGVYSGGDANGYFYVYETCYGVRPALRLNLKSSISKSSNKAAKLAASKSPATLTLATSIAAFFENGTFTLSNTVDGNRYMVYGIKNYSDSAKITSTNLVYINQSQASNGKAVFEYKPSSSSTATVVVVGDFGDGTEEKVVKLKDKSELTAELEIKTPSKTTINYGDGIVLHLDVENLPSGAEIVWEASNENFTYTVSSDGKTCTITSKSSGKTTFTATVFDEDGLELSSDTQEMTSKAGFFQKFAAFFKKLFGLLVTYPQSL